MNEVSYKIYLHFNGESKKYDGYRLLKYADEKCKDGIGEIKTVIENGSIEECIIMVDLLGDGYLEDRKTWEENAIINSMTVDI